MLNEEQLKVAQRYISQLLEEQQQEEKKRSGNIQST